MNNESLIAFLNACRYMGIDPIDAVNIFKDLKEEKGESLTLEQFSKELSKLIKN